MPTNAKLADFTGLDLRNVTKSYGAHTVLSSVSFSVESGETAAVLGENGAGKSTLAKVLAGVVRADGGTISVDGRTVALNTPRKALEEGIAFIPQELLYVPRLTVAENICLGRWPTRGPWTSSLAMRRRAAADCARIGLELDLSAEMAALPVAQQQMVEIVKAFARQTRVIVLDEPTAALSSHDSDLLLEQMASLARAGTAILYISHRIDEVFRACDTVHVLRNGVLVHSAGVKDSAPREVIKSMLGGELDGAGGLSKGPSTGDVTALAVRRLNKASTPELRDISFDVMRGEIVGIYGVRGSGAESIAEVFGGLSRDTSFEATLGKVTVKRVRSPRAAKKLKIAHVPADRKTQGLVLSMPVAQAMTLLVLPQLSSLRFVRRRRERALAARMAHQVLLRARTTSQPVGTLSGGNQQKALVASRLVTDPEVLVLQEPTRGVDIGARLELHRLIRSQADAGTAVLVVSSDIEEIAILSDRVLVVAQGAIVAEVTAPSVTSQSQILEAAGGFV